MRRIPFAAIAVVAFALLLAAPVSADTQLTYTMEGDGEVSWLPGSSTIVLMPAKGGEILSFTVNGIEHLGDLVQDGSEYRYVSAELLESEIHVKFSVVGGGGIFGHPLFPIILILGIAVAVALFLVRRKVSSAQ